MAVGLTVGLAVAFGVGEELAEGVGVKLLVGEGLVKITLIPSSGTGETTLLRPKANQTKRIISKMRPKIAAR